MPNILFEDESLLVLEKEHGLVVTSTETHQEETLEDILRLKHGISIERSGIVHRLDKDTSGLLVVGKTVEVVQNLQSQFKSRTVKKEYLALVHGLVEKSGKVEGAIGRNPAAREKFVVFENLIREDGEEFNAKDAVTEYEPIGNFKFSISNFQSVFNDLNKIQSRKLERTHYNQFTLLRCLPLTGRTHQIRVHLKYIGFPIVGDDKYGGRKTTRLDHRWIGRQFLHAARLEFDHPKSGERMVFESKLPEDLKQALGKLDKVA